MGDFETLFTEYVSGVERFVEAVHSGLSDLQTAAIEPTQPAPTPAFEQVTTRIRSQITSPKKILVVDEVEINRVLFGRYFQGLPFEISFARTQAEARAQLDRQAFDLVIYDWKDYLSRGLSRSDLIEQVVAKISVT